MHERLTARENQVAELVADGMSNREAAGELKLSEHTIKKYMLHIFEKLGVSNRVEMTRCLMSLASVAGRVRRPSANAD
jgi:DNA-binding NarL/FixJ family response regulator